MYRLLVLALLCALTLAAPAVPPAKAPLPKKPDGTGRPSEAETLMADYRKSKSTDEKFQKLVALRRFQDRAVNKFLQEEYDRLDMDLPGDARLGGAILRTWAAQGDDERLPVLLFEGLFHDDASVVRSCANAAAKAEAETRAVLSTGRAPAGREPHQEMAVDLITRMMERHDIVPALEKVLVAWSGKRRADYQPDGKMDAATTTATIEFWKKWYEERFRAKFQPDTETKAGEKKR